VLGAESPHPREGDAWTRIFSRGAPRRRTGTGLALTACFLDVDGVITDFAQLPRQWDTYMGDVIAPALGRTPEEWGRANRAVFPSVWARNEEWGTDPAVRQRREAIEILAAMCEHLGEPVPPEDRSAALWLDVETHVAEQATAVFPGARSAIEALSQRWSVHTATGNPSRRVVAYFRGMDALHLLGVPSGPDLVGIWKQAPEFYERTFALAGVDARDALVVDDDPARLVTAASLGARTVHVDGADREPQGSFDAVISVIDELPAAVERIAAGM
jgi:HAD superfamily hydrolase (TIGR01509 family)